MQYPGINFISNIHLIDVYRTTTFSLGYSCFELPGVGSKEFIKHDYFHYFLKKEPD